MATRRNLYMSHNFIEVEEYHDGRYGARGEKREKKRKPTREQMEKVNRINRAKKVRRMMREYFQENDYYLTLTYAPENRPPNMETAQSDFRKFIGKVKGKYKKAGCPLFWIRNIEHGSRGAWHVHMVINRIPGADVIIKGAWMHGGIHFQLMYEQGGFTKLADYITKTEKEEKRILESSYSRSRNMPMKPPKVVKLRRWPKKPYVKKGWRMEEESFYEGVNPITGYQYRHYTLVRPHRRI